MLYMTFISVFFATTMFVDSLAGLNADGFIENHGSQAKPDSHFTVIYILGLDASQAKPDSL